MNRQQRRESQRAEKGVVKTAVTLWARTLKRPCASCGEGPSWQIIQRDEDVWYQCALCGEDAFRIPFRSDALAAEFVKQNLEAET